MNLELGIAQYGYYAAALILVLALFGILAWAFKRFGGGKMVLGGKRGKRLEISEVSVVDKYRRLLLIRCDDQEHLVMIGGPQDVVVKTGMPYSGGQFAEQNINQTMPMEAQAKEPEVQRASAPRVQQREPANTAPPAPERTPGPRTPQASPAPARQAAQEARPNPRRQEADSRAPAPNAAPQHTSPSQPPAAPRQRPAAPPPQQSSMPPAAAPPPAAALRPAPPPISPEKSAQSSTTSNPFGQEALKQGAESLLNVRPGETK